MRFDDRVALVTGASSGIGAAVAKAFLNEGAKVFAVGGRRVPWFDVSDKSLFETYRCDLTDGDAPAEVVSATMRRFGRIDYLINAAGVLLFGGCATTSNYDWSQSLDVNLMVPFKMLRAAAPELSARRGAVVNISSINSYRPFANTLAYSVSKAGLDQFTRCAAIELAPHVRVNAVNPGVVITDLHTQAGMNEADYAEFLKRSLFTHPMGRPGIAEEVASAVLFLCGHNWMTGVCLPVDGGRNLTVVR